MITDKKPPVIYAEDVPYFQTGQSSADDWLDKSKREIVGIGGKVLSQFA